MVAGGNIVTEYSYDTDRNLVNQKTYVKNSWEHGQRESFTSLSASKVCDFDAIRTAPRNKMGIRNLSLGQMYGNARVIVDDTYQYDPLGNMTSKKTLSVFSKYSYDAEGLLAKDRGIAVTVKHELLPDEYFIETNINYEHLDYWIVLF